MFYHDHLAQKWQCMSIFLAGVPSVWWLVVALAAHGRLRAVHGRAVMSGRSNEERSESSKERGEPKRPLCCVGCCVAVGWLLKMESPACRTLLPGKADLFPSAAACSLTQLGQAPPPSSEHSSLRRSLGGARSCACWLLGGPAQSDSIIALRFQFDSAILWRIRSQPLGLQFLFHASSADPIARASCKDGWLRRCRRATSRDRDLLFFDGGTLTQRTAVRF